MKKFLSIFLCLIIFCSFCACSGEKIIWDDIVLGDVLPEPPETTGKIYTNSNENLMVDIYNISDSQFADYIDSCKDKGFTTDANIDSLSFDAYNSEGYKLHLTHLSSDKMSIDLESPMEMTTISWPTSTAGKLLPVPKSTTGKFSYENEDSFFVYIGNTSKDDYVEYVNACSSKGFNVDYNKGEDFYYASNSQGCNIDIRYVGYNIMSVKIDAKIEDEPVTEKVTLDVETYNNDTKNEETKKNSNNSSNNGIDPDFKAAMDSYEEFMDEYVAFMKKYNNNPSDLTLLSEYADYMSKYSDFLESFEKWGDKEMNTAETTYYLDVQTRVNKKLLEIAQ